MDMQNVELWPWPVAVWPGCIEAEIEIRSALIHELHLQVFWLSF